MEHAAQQARIVFGKCRELLGAGRTPDPPAAAAAGTSTSSNIWELRSRVLGAVPETESICNSLSSGVMPSQAAVVGALTSSAGAIAGLASHAYDQHQQISELKQQYHSLASDSGKMLMRQMATQTVNKLARKVSPGLSAYDARDMHMSIVADMAKSDMDSNAYQQVVNKYRKLKPAVKDLCDLGRLVAHLIPQPPVSEELLREAINNNVSQGLRAYAEEVLACLVELASDLREPLFVSTEPQQGHP
ncbi:hypothetical protein TSOC_008801 [Tetrabaena socialis]|uniref:Uncharacterized protein n=1 Tax=Tetrabaena socialis TaxID=47790 RepID=A0A2J7ZXK1_9CHLO|nr:hypothetical protein TSOC_008801 [Tetrabaena socialis]|eukprot:PNH04994.1 hypothetical protein TSOC_008801 [Tetrabaena socialis]